MAAKLTVLGLGGRSVFMELDHFHDPGETLHCDSMHVEPGGKGYNQAVAASRLGAEVCFIGAMGDDSDGATCLSFLANEGVKAEIETIPGQHTAFACILTDKAGNNRVTVSRGASDNLSAGFILSCESVIAESDMLLLNLEYPAAANTAALELAEKHGVPVLFNPAPWSQEADRLIKRAFVITPNRQEAAALAGLEPEADPQKTMDVLNTLGYGSVAITLGHEGALIDDCGRRVYIPVQKRRAVDTTGAGDCFSAALAVAITGGASMEDAARYAVKASGISVGKRYVMASLPYETDIT